MPRFAVRQSSRRDLTSHACLALLGQCFCDFEAIEPFCNDRFFKWALGLAKMPSSVWLRQRLDAVAAELREVIDALSLRLLGQLDLTGTIAPVRHTAKRRRLKTVLQEIMYRTARVIEHARRMVLDFGRGVVALMRLFIHLQERLQVPPP